MAEQYQAVSALDGRVIKSYPVTSASEISGQMTAARLAANTWAAYSVAERVKILLALQTVILANVDAITDTLELECILVNTWIQISRSDNA